MKTYKPKHKILGLQGIHIEIPVGQYSSISYTVYGKGS